MDLITENSIGLYKQIHEGTTETDIASFEAIINRLSEDKYKTSLAYQICEVQPLTNSAGAIFVAKKDTNGNVKIVKELSNVLKDTETTGMSIEAFEDINKMFKGKRATTLMTNILKGTSDKNENIALMTKLDSSSTTLEDILLTDIGNAETTVFETSKRVCETILKINGNDTVKSLNGFAILPHNVAASFMAMNGITPGQNNGLFIGQYGRVKYYAAPNNTYTDIYVGIVDKNLVGKSSLVFSPYQYTLSKSVKYNNGEENVFVINRYALTENPLSKDAAEDKMLYKFSVTEGL